MTTIEPFRPNGLDTSGTAAVHYLAGLRPSGRRTQRTALCTLGGILLGFPVDEPTNVPWGQLRYEHASALRSILQAKYAPATVNKHLTAMRGVARAAWRMKHLDGEDLARIVDVPNIKGSRLKSGRMLSREELGRLWTIADSEGGRYPVLLAFLFSGGLRRSEAAAVTTDHIHQATAADGGNVVWVRVEGKGGKERNVPLRGSAACRVWTYLGSPFAPEPTKPVLGVRKARSVAKMLERIVRLAAIDPCSPHDLRRSFVSYALAGGAPIADVARAAGHSDPRTTAGYDHRADDALVGVADALSR